LENVGIKYKLGFSAVIKVLYGSGIVSARIAEMILRVERAVAPIAAYEPSHCVTFSMPAVVGAEGWPPPRAVDVAGGTYGVTAQYRNAAGSRAARAAREPLIYPDRDESRGSGDEESLTKRWPAGARQFARIPLFENAPMKGRRFA